jgi:hypothetical protein
MKNIIPKDTRYIPLTQQKSCCVPASINMVLYKLGLHLVPQELLGHHLGLIIAKEDKHLFWQANTGERPKSGYGTRISLKQYNPNMAFKKLGVPLRMIIHPVAEFKSDRELVSFVSSKIKDDKNILVRLNSGALNNSSKNGGHVCVVDRIYPKENKIRIIDPSPSQSKWREIKISKLKKAMELHPDGLGGFLELEKIK